MKFRYKINIACIVLIKFHNGLNSVLHLNIRSMKKNIEAFQDFIESLNFKFSAICLSETWLQPHEISDSNF